MSLEPEIAAARDDVRRARSQLSTTLNELEERITAPVQAVKQRLEVGRVVREHPWAALAVAVGTGVAIATSGADKRAATVAADTAKQGAAKVKQGGIAGLALARQAPARSRGVLGGAIDSFGARVAVQVIEALRGPGVKPLPPSPSAGLGFVDNAAPAHETVFVTASPESQLP